MGKFLTILNLVVNGLFIGLLLLSGLSTQVNPERFVFFSFLGLSFIPLIIINVLFVAFWIVKLKWYFVFSLLALIITFSSFKNIFPIHNSKNIQFVQNDSTQFTLLSYNVKLFDFYKKNKGLDNYNKTVNYLLEKDADIVCLQEFGYFNKKGYLNAADILTVMAKKYKYRHIEYYINSDETSTYGVATFSKYPIIKRKTVDYESKFNFTICSEIQIRDKVVQLYNCHLESNQLTLDDKKMMFELVDSTSQEKIAQTTGLLFRKFGNAAKLRAKQADAISGSIQEGDSTVVLCGDFNDSPVSYTYRKIKGDLVDAFSSTSSGMGITYTEFPFLFRIDYIFHSSNIVSGKFEIERVEFSDHYPISCVIDLGVTNKQIK